MWKWAALLLIGCGAAQAENLLVLPFFNHTGSASLDWIGESISETVHDSVVSEGVLAVDREERLEGCERLSLRPDAELTHASILKLGDVLDASLVVYGTYELLPAEPGKTSSRGSLRITARVLDLKHMRQGAPFSETAALEDLASLEFRLSWQTLQEIGWKKMPPEDEFLKERPAVRLDAMESFARGLVAASAEQRHLFFTRAARLDEHYSQPCFQLGRIYWAKKDYKIAAGWLERVTRSDSHYFEAQFFLGLCHYNLGEFAAAAECLQRVADAVPLNEVYNDLGAAQARRNDSAGAIASFHKALDGDSGDPDYHFNLGYLLWLKGDYAAAVESLRAVVARNPSDAEATALLGRALMKEGPRPGDPRTEARERIKTNYEEMAYRQLQAELGK